MHLIIGQLTTALLLLLGSIYYVENYKAPFKQAPNVPTLGSKDHKSNKKLSMNMVTIFESDKA